MILDPCEFRGVSLVGTERRDSTPSERGVPRTAVGNATVPHFGG